MTGTTPPLRIRLSFRMTMFRLRMETKWDAMKWRFACWLLLVAGRIFAQEDEMALYLQTSDAASATLSARAAHLTIQVQAGAQSISVLVGHKAKLARALRSKDAHGLLVQLAAVCFKLHEQERREREMAPDKREALTPCGICTHPLGEHTDWQYAEQAPCKDCPDGLCRNPPAIAAPAAPLPGVDF